MKNDRERRSVKILALTSLVVLLIATVLTATAPAIKASGSVEPQTSAMGKDLGDWFEFWGKWNSAGGSNHHGSYIYMPLPVPSCTENTETGFWDCQGQVDVTLKHNEGFFMPATGYVGWRYHGWPEVPDDEPLPASLLYDISLDITLDGDEFLNDWDFDLEDWYALEYYNPILYVEEEGWLADIFVQGVGFICPPLSVGEHTLHLDEVWPAFGVTYDNTWNITVVYGGG